MITDIVPVLLVLILVAMVYLLWPVHQSYKEGLNVTPINRRNRV